MGQRDIKQQIYEKNITLERKFARMLKAILGNQFITQDVVMDRQEGTDFAIMTVNPFKIGVRLRRYKFYLKYPEQFTIRWSLPSGNKTEIDKIRAGFVRYLFYGFVDKTQQSIIQYFIGDLLIFRLAETQGLKPIRIFSNKPPDFNKGAAFNIKDLPSDFVIKKYGFI